MNKAGIKYKMRVWIWAIETFIFGCNVCGHRKKHEEDCIFYEDDEE